MSSRTTCAFLGERLNLKAHTISGVELFGPADMEGHLGEDGRFYSCDFSRLFPPEDPTRPDAPASWILPKVRAPLVTLLRGVRVSLIVCALCCVCCVKVCVLTQSEHAPVSAASARVCAALRQPALLGRLLRL